jgi:hypothetical protein
MLGTILAPGARADEWDKKTIVTFSGPVEIPGRVLSAGTYVFKLLDSEYNLHVVQIFSKDEKQLYATILAIPDSRLKPTGKTVITFEERAAGAPEAIKAWFYPGDTFGQEFVYPKARAVELAKATQQPVRAMPSALAPNITKPTKSAQEPHVVAMKKAPITTVAPSGEETQMAQAMPPKPAPSLPHTASPLPLVGLLGLLATGAGFALRAARRLV